MNEFEKNGSRIRQQGKRDNPEGIPTEKESLFDRFKSERTVDAIPVEDQAIEQRDEKRKEQTKHDSSSERKYRTGMQRDS